MLLASVCHRRLLSLSVMRYIGNVTHQGEHKAGQLCYIPLGRHLVYFLLHDAILLVEYMLWLCVSPAVRLSVTSWYCTKMDIGSCKQCHPVVQRHWFSDAKDLGET